MANQEDRFVVKTFQRLPSERVRQPSQEAICTELDRIRREIVPLTNKELLAAFCNDHIMLEWFKSLGSDQIIVAYAFNFIRKCGKINDDMISMNKFNQELFRRLSLGSRENSIPNVPVFVTSSIYEPSVYGADFVDSFAKRLGIKASGTSINFLISTTMDPWISDTASGDFIPVITSEIKKIIQDILTQSKFD